MRLPILWFLACSLGFGATEQGELNGAKFRIFLPETWNGGLVMFCHGYSPEPTLENEKSMSVFLSRGYAVAASAYREGGWSTAEAVEDTEALRAEFAKRHGAPKETWVSGMSMGGQITLLTIEKHGARYNGALPLCGANQAEFDIMSTIFANRALFDYYFPDVLPRLDAVPPTLRASRDFAASLAPKLKANPAGLEAMKRWLGFHGDFDVLVYAALTTEIIGDVQRRAGGNPFDNRAVLYDDPAVEKGVKRYAADEKARAWLLARQQLTGKVGKPVLALQKTNDGLVTSDMTNAYPRLAVKAGSGSLFVQQYVEGSGHCTFTPDQVGASFDALCEWGKSGKQPPVGLIGSTRP